MKFYKELVKDMHKYTVKDNELNSFKRLLSAQLSTRQYKCYYSTRTAGSMYYNSSVVSGKAVELVYKLLTALDCREVSTGSLAYVHNLVSNQATLFAKSADFDYRSLWSQLVQKGN